MLFVCMKQVNLFSLFDTPPLQFSLISYVFLEFTKNLIRPTPSSLCERLDGEHLGSEAAINPGNQVSQAGSPGSPPLGALQGSPVSPSLRAIQGNSRLGGVQGSPVNTSLTRHPFASLQAKWIVSSSASYPFILLIFIIRCVFSLDVNSPLQSVLMLSLICCCHGETSYFLDAMATLALVPLSTFIHALALAFKCLLCLVSTGVESQHQLERLDEKYQVKYLLKAFSVGIPYICR